MTSIRISTAAAPRPRVTTQAAPFGLPTGPRAEFGMSDVRLADAAKQAAPPPGVPR